GSAGRTLARAAGAGRRRGAAAVGVAGVPGTAVLPAGGLGAGVRVSPRACTAQRRRLSRRVTLGSGDRGTMIPCGDDPAPRMHPGTTPSTMEVMTMSWIILV